MLDKTSILRPHARAPAAALKYLRSCRAKAISICADVDGAEIKVGYDQNAELVFWLPAKAARSVAARARHRAGDGAGVDDAEAALKEAAAKCRATLTPHDVAISRAGTMAAKLKQKHRH